MPLTELDRIIAQPDHISVVQHGRAIDPHVVEPGALFRVVVLEREPPVRLAHDFCMDQLEPRIVAAHERQRRRTRPGPEWFVRPTG